MQDLVEHGIYIMSNLRKIMVGTAFYYEATVNDYCHVKMSADMSARMEKVAREHRFSKFEMRNLHMKMVAVRTFNWTLGHYEKKLILIDINRYGGFSGYRFKAVACIGNDPGKKGGEGSSGMASEVLLNV